MDSAPEVPDAVATINGHRLTRWIIEDVEDDLDCDCLPRGLRCLAHLRAEGVWRLRTVVVPPEAVVRGVLEHCGLAEEMVEGEVLVAALAGALDGDGLWAMIARHAE